jgi:methionyl aminopeptidase
MSFQIFTDAEIASFRKGGAILRGCLDMLGGVVQAGMTTKQVDELAEAYIIEHGGQPAFKGYHGFPATLCTSINEQCVHGIPSDRVIQEGDIVKLDCGVLYDDLYTDACITVGIGTVSPAAKNLLKVTKLALEKAVDFVKAGVRVGDLSSLIQRTVEAGGCKPLKSLTGHGLGRNLHQFPDIPNLGKAGTGPVFPAGTVVAIEPIVAVSGSDVQTTGDGWTLVTDDGSLAAHFEHTVLILEDGCEIIA